MALIGFEQVIARQRAETAQIALNAVADRGAAHTTMMNTGFPQARETGETLDVETMETVPLGRFGSDFSFILS